MGAEKSRSNDCTCTVIFEGDSRAFDANNPIVGTIQLDAKATIPAYCIQATLQQREHSLKID